MQARRLNAKRNPTRHLPTTLLAAVLLPFLAAPGLRSQSPQAPAGTPPTETATAPAERPVYDGDWWLSLGGWEQSGFITGYEDCYNSEYHGTVPFTKEAQSTVDELNKYFLADPARRKQTVSDALDELRSAASDSALPSYKLANPPPPDQPPAAVYDGHFWFDADPAAELGFVEGYLACHSAKLKDADAKFSRAPAELVDRITQAYGITDDTEDVAADKGAVKISEVLHQLKDPDPAPAKPASNPK